MFPRRVKAMPVALPERREARRALSTREVEVLRLLSGPLSLRDIGQELHISHQTVKNHAKPSPQTRHFLTPEAVALGRKLGLLSLLALTRPDRRITLELPRSG